jgi:hypothetical protein
MNFNPFGLGGDGTTPGLFFWTAGSAVADVVVGVVRHGAAPTASLRCRKSGRSG